MVHKVADAATETMRSIAITMVRREGAAKAVWPAAAILPAQIWDTPRSKAWAGSMQSSESAWATGSLPTGRGDTLSPPPSPLER